MASTLSWRIFVSVLLMCVGGACTSTSSKKHDAKWQEKTTQPKVYISDVHKIGQVTPNQCGLSALLTAMSAWGFKTTVFVNQKSDLTIRVPGRLSAKDLKRIASDFGYDAFIMSFQTPAMAHGFLREQMVACRPVIIALHFKPRKQFVHYQRTQNLQRLPEYKVSEWRTNLKPSPNEVYHYATLIGYDEANDMYLLWDPVSGDKILHRRALEQLCDTTDSLVILVAGKSGPSVITASM